MLTRSCAIERVDALVLPALSPFGFNAVKGRLFGNLGRIKGRIGHCHGLQVIGV